MTPLPLRPRASPRTGSVSTCRRERPSADALTAALASLRPAADGRFRIAHPVINSWLAWTALEIGMPLQIHVGYGDADLDLLRADPLRLTAFLRATEKLEVPVLLLHNYPYHRNAAYLAQVYSHVFLDVGLAVHNTGALSQALIRETLETAPFGKVVYSSDAYGLAELYYLGAELFRRGLSTILGELIKADEMTSADADHVAALIARDNARRVYGLDGVHDRTHPLGSLGSARGPPTRVVGLGRLIGRVQLALPATRRPGLVASSRREPARPSTRPGTTPASCPRGQLRQVGAASTRSSLRCTRPAGQMPHQRSTARTRRLPYG